MSQDELRFNKELQRQKATTQELKDPKLAIRRNGQSRFIWELLSDDGHVVNRSDDDFATLTRCQADATARGHN